MGTKTVFVVEYCREQSAFHVETVPDMLENNNRILEEGGPAYIPLAFASNIKEARRICREKMDIEQRENIVS
ncbi:MAG: hypothetical protein KBS74_01310 [Clostridiales bacterium]|nr:hypothetical protein [Candidatus Cacconaster stercorequi]